MSRLGSCTILHFQQWSTNVPVVPPSSSTDVVDLWVILPHTQWYLMVTWVCVAQIANSIELFWMPTGHPYSCLCEVICAHFVGCFFNDVFFILCTFWDITGKYLSALNSRIPWRYSFNRVWVVECQHLGFGF